VWDTLKGPEVTVSDSTGVQHGPPKSWLILVVMLLFSIAAPLNQFKVPPVVPVLMGELGISVGRAGLLMSVFALSGLIFAIPAGFIFHSTGYRRSGLIAGGSIVCGAVLGAVSHSTTLLLFSRLIEGVGTSFMAVLAPAVINEHFTERRRATAIGIWAIWVPVGSTAMLVLAPRILVMSGWRGVWWIGASYAFVVTALYLAVVRPAATLANRTGVDSDPSDDANPRQVLRNRNVWLLAAVFAALSACVSAIGTYLPTFLNTLRHLDLGSAALTSSLLPFVTIFSAPAAGVVSDRIGSRRTLFVLGLALAAVILPVTGFVPVAWVVGLMAVSGLVIGAIPSTAFTAAIESVADPRMGGAAMAVIMVGQNSGMLVGPIIFGGIVESLGWPFAFVSLALTAFLGVIAGLRADVR